MSKEEDVVSKKSSSSSLSSGFDRLTRKLYKKRRPKVTERDLERSSVASSSSGDSAVPGHKCPPAGGKFEKTDDENGEEVAIEMAEVENKSGEMLEKNGYRDPNDFDGEISENEHKNEESSAWRVSEKSTKSWFVGVGEIFREYWTTITHALGVLLYGTEKYQFSKIY
jgi:hypothetical protein